MNAELLWMRWQADGTPVPMVVCEALSFLARYYAGIRQRSINTGDVGVVDDRGYVRPLEDSDFAHAVVRGYQPMPLTPYMIDLLKKWVAYVASYNDEWSEEVHRMDDDPETRAWAGLPGPVTEVGSER